MKQRVYRILLFKQTADMAPLFGQIVYSPGPMIVQSDVPILYPDTMTHQNLKQIYPMLTTELDNYLFVRSTLNWL